MGFTREWFTRVKETLGLSLSPCIYDPEDQQRLIQDEIDEFFATNAEREPDYWDRNRGYGIQIGLALTWYCGMQGMISQLV